MPNRDDRRNGDCRYCERYRRACGRDHAVGRGDWSRDWAGNPRGVTR